MRETPNPIPTPSAMEMNESRKSFRLPWVTESPAPRSGAHQGCDEHGAYDDRRGSLHEPKGCEHRGERHHHDEVGIGRARAPHTLRKRNAVFSLQ